MGATATTQVYLRVVGGTEARREFEQTAETGRRAMERLGMASRPASQGLLAVDAVARDLRGRLEGTAAQVPVLGAGLVRLGPAGVAAGVALAGLYQAVKNGLKEVAEAEEAQNRLEAALRATGNTTGLTGREIAEFSEQLAGRTRATAQEVQEAAAVLATFGAVSGENFKRALTAAQDMAAGLGGTVRERVQLLGLALADPQQAVERLRRSGIDLGRDTDRLITEFAAAGREAEAFGAILSGVERRVGGQGEAQQQGLAGAMSTLAKNVRDLAQEIAKATGASDGLTRFFNLMATGAAAWRKDLERLANPDLWDRIVRNNLELQRVEQRIAEHQASGSPSDVARVKRLEDRRAELQAETEILRAEAERTAAGARAEDQAKTAAIQGAEAAANDRAFERLSQRLLTFGRVREELRRQLEAAQLPQDEREKTQAADAAEKRLREAFKSAGAGEPDAESVKNVRDMARATVEFGQATEFRFAAERQLSEAMAREDAEKAQRVQRVFAEIDAETAREAPRIQAIKSVRDHAQALAEERQAIGETERERFVRLTALGAERRLLDEGVENAREYVDALKAEAGALYDASRAYERAFGTQAQAALRGYVDYVGDTGRQIRQQIVGGFEAGEDAVAQFARTGKLSLQDFTDFAIESLARVAYQRALALGAGGEGAGGGLLALLGSGARAAFGAFGGAEATAETPAAYVPGDAPFPVLPSRRGNVFDRGRVREFRLGGVVGARSYFDIGSMAEDGPEAVMPLSRDRSGRLGVRWEGNGGGAPSVALSFNIDARGAEAGVEARIEAAIQRQVPGIVNTAVAAVADRTRRGGSYAKTMGRR